MSPERRQPLLSPETVTERLGAPGTLEACRFSFPILPLGTSLKDTARIEAAGATSLFLLGLIIGMIAAIAAFCLYLKRQSVRAARQEEAELRAMLEDVAERHQELPGRGRRRQRPPSDNRTSPTAPLEPKKPESPWERPADWWREDS